MGTGDHALGHASGWTVEEDVAHNRYRWIAHGFAGTRDGHALTRGEAERAAQDAGRELSVLRGPALPKSGAEFESFYAHTPPWEIDRPQPAIHELAGRGALRGRVLDVGCGSGEHALLAASLGLNATGVDAAPTAISLARKKAHARGLDARFVVGDALDLPAMFDTPFDTVIDSALFHVFDDDDRQRFVRALAGVTAAGGRYFLLCFGDQAPGTGGPRRLSEAEIRLSFTRGWRVESVVAAHVETIGMAVPAWLATIVRA